MYNGNFIGVYVLYKLIFTTYSLKRQPVCAKHPYRLVVKLYSCVFAPATTYLEFLVQIDALFSSKNFSVCLLTDLTQNESPK